MSDLDRSLIGRRSRISSQPLRMAFVVISTARSDGSSSPCKAGSRPSLLHGLQARVAGTGSQNEILGDIPQSEPRIFESLDWTDQCSRR